MMRGMTELRMIKATIHLSAALHERMKLLQFARRQQDGFVPLNRLFAEAVKFYLEAAPQRELLEAAARARGR
jgi:hypothetical protein